MEKILVPPETPCKHCGLPVGKHPVGTDPFFCCTGCAVVYDALHAAGYGDTFYRLQKISPGISALQPAKTRVDALKVSELDSETYLTRHTRATTLPGILSTELFVDGVHCAACVWLVEQMPFVMEGVHETRLDLPRARLTIHWDPRVVLLSDVARWLAQFGYIVHPVQSQENQKRTTAERRLLLKVGVSWALAGNVMLIAFALYSGLDMRDENGLATAARWASLFLSLPSVIYGGSEFFRRAWASAKVAWKGRDLRRLHMDTPIALGILAGFGHSTWATVSGKGEVWFDSITILIAALLTARWLQLRSRRLAGDASERLLSLIPSMTRRTNETGTTEIVRIDELHPNDVVEIPAGEVIPVDGAVVSGSSRIDNAVLTGESRSEAVAPGDLVQAGATNVSSTLHIRVHSTGEATRVGKLLAWIQNKEGLKAPVVLMADRLSGYFVAGVLVLGLLTASIWLMIAPEEALYHVIALLVITCPCALGMSTPLAMAIASGRAAHLGIFVKSDEATEQLTHVTAIVLDKTGTLTQGRMALVDFEGQLDAIDLAAVLENHSNHPIALALVQARGSCSLEGRTVDLPEVGMYEVIAGKGIHGIVSGHKIAVGSPDWITSRVGRLPAELFQSIRRYSELGQTPICVEHDRQCVATLAFGDRLRESTADIIEHLQKMGKEVHVLSGDHIDVVQGIARQLGIPSSRALGNVSPEEKLSYVTDLQSRGHVVMMVGDGVNDGAALQAANVGIAVQGGSTVSLVAADVFLTREGLDPILDLLAGARRVMHLIRRNLTISLLYNVAGAAAAISGLVSPLIAAIAMPISSLYVVSSSILQHSFRKRHTGHAVPINTRRPQAEESSVSIMGTVSREMLTDSNEK